MIVAEKVEKKNRQNISRERPDIATRTPMLVKLLLEGRVSLFNI